MRDVETVSHLIQNDGEDPASLGEVHVAVRQLKLKAVSSRAYHEHSKHD